MGINTHQASRPAGRYNRTLSDPNFTVVNKMMVNSRLVKLPHGVHSGKTSQSSRHTVSEMREDWIEILLDAGLPVPASQTRNDEPTHFIV